MTDWLTGGPARDDMAEAVERIQGDLVGEGAYDRDEASRRAGVELRDARRLWQALGFANVPAGEDVFTDADVEALAALDGLVASGTLDRDGAVSMARALGRTAERLAIWQAEMVGEGVRQRRDGPEAAGARLPLGEEPAVPGRLDPQAAREAARELGAMADALEPLLVYAWRRHVAGALSRLVADAAPSEDAEGVRRTVGFLDMVSFTAFVQQASDVELSRLVQRFEAVSSDVVAAHGGRVVKSLGDEVLYQAFDARTAAQIALDVVAAAAVDDLLPPLRAGIATGRVVPRLGDVYGTTVNRAARLIRQAAAGTVLIDESTARALESAGGWQLAGLAPRTLHGLGTVRPWQLLAGPAPGAPGAPGTTYAPATGPIPTLPDMAVPAPVPYIDGSTLGPAARQTLVPSARTGPVPILTHHDDTRGTA